MLDFQGFSKTNNGELRVIALAASDALPAGTVMFNGLAKTPEGYLVVVFA